MGKGHTNSLPEDSEFTSQGRFVSYISLFPKSRQTSPPTVILIPQNNIDRIDPETTSNPVLTRMEDLQVSIAGIAHDINGTLQLLNCAIGFIEEELRTEAEAKNFDLIKISAHRLHELSSNLSALSRDEPADVAASTDVSDILRSTAKACLADTEVELRADIEEPLFIKTDQAQFARIIQNLVLNAIQAMGRKGRLKIEAQTVTDESVFRFVEITVADSGCGIEPADLPRIFDLYFTTKDDGKGLGLAIVQALVDKIGGRISVASTLGQGTTFTLRFPALPPHGDKP
jgi:signal transduction histidine kinase